MRKIPMQLHGTNFCSSSAHFAPSFVSQPNGPKCTKIVRTHKNMSLGSNGVDRVRSLRKILTRLRSTNFCTSSARYAPSLYGNQTVQNASKLYETHQNMSLGSNGVDRVRSLGKILTRLRGTNFCTSSARFAPSFKSQQNGPKCTKIVRTHKNMSLGSNGVDRVRSLRKIPTRLRGTNFCTSSARFCTKFCMATKRSKMHQNCTKRTKT